jgi:opacity protein-like surface antigen
MHTDWRGHGFSAGALRIGLLVGIACGTLCAQVDVDWNERGELSLFTGMGFGRIGSRPAVGGSTGVFLNQYAALLIGSTFLPLGSATIVPRTPLTTQSHLYDSNFTLDVQVPIKRRWAPYGLLSTAVLYNTYQLQATRPDGTLYFAGQGDVKFAFEGGGGLRYTIGESWGVKGEYRRTVSTQDFNRVTFGVFYRLPSNWPFLATTRK